MSQVDPTAPVSLAYLQTLFAYDAWATGRVFATAAALEPAALDATPLSGLGSLRSILVHMVSATWVWRTRLAGTMPTAMLDPSELASLAAIEARWSAEDTALRAMLTHFDVATLAAPLSYQTTSGKTFTTPRWQILVHLANHGTQHRSEAAALLTALGHSPGDLDMIVYFRAIAPTDA
ncbi:MAG: DinB family protein [Oscillochloridaceae bacterium umkhey_bin13]